MRLIYIFLTLIFLPQLVSAQEIRNAPQTNYNYLGNNANDKNDVSGLNKIRVPSEHEEALIGKIKQLKENDSPENKEELIKLEEELAKLRGEASVITSPSPTGAILTRVPENSAASISIDNNRIYNNPNSTIKGIATAVEQRGSSAGKIWLVYVFSGNPAFPDSIRIYNSTNGGNTWNFYVTGNFAPYDRMVPGELDLEIIENNSGQKYLWLICGYTDPTGDLRSNVGGFIMQAPSVNGVFLTFNWPDGDSLKRYYNPRITSDNSVYLNNPYTYIICSFDSTDGNGNHFNGQKYVRCLNPYTVSPAFTYQPENFYWYSNPGPAGYVRDVYSDIAYFQNGGQDSIIVSFSGVPDSNTIFFSKADITGSLASVGGSSTQGGSDPNSMKTNARLSSNGNGNGSVICVFNQYSSGNRNVKYFRTDNYGNFNSLAGQSVLWGSLTNQNYRPDIIGTRNGDIHYFTFGTSDAVADSIQYISVTTDGITNQIHKMNAVDSVTGSAPPVAGFRYVDGDSCFILYSGPEAHSVWNARGCTGDPIGILNISAPVRYSLSQNYPNPFNPVTRINFSIPVRGYVRLALFDLLGKEVAMLVNSDKEAGSYIIDFNASAIPSGVYFYKLESGEFKETKKMLVVK